MEGKSDGVASSTAMGSPSTSARMDLSENVEQSLSENGSTSEGITFSPELVKKYEKRFENGYDVYTDEKYIQWMRKFHPDHLPPG